MGRLRFVESPFHWTNYAIALTVGERPFDIGAPKFYTASRVAKREYTVLDVLLILHTHRKVGLAGQGDLRFGAP